MKVVMLYRPNTEYARRVEEYAHDLEREHQARIEMQSLDTRDGSSMASLYDVVQYPAILVLADNGQLLKEWQGDNFPLKAEISYYTHA